MSFSLTGFTVEDMKVIIGRIKESFKLALPDINFTPDNILTHWAEILAFEKRDLQTQIKESFSNMTVMGAKGIFLDKHGLENGIYRKPAKKASTDLVVNWEFNDSNAVTSGSMFATSDGKNFIANSNTVFETSFASSHSADYEDDIPYPLTGISSISIDGYTEGDDFTYTGDVITWSITGFSEGDAYTVSVSGEEGGVIIPVVAESAGTGWNVSSNSITIDVNGLGVTSVTNPEQVYNGEEVESDDDFRKRILRSRRKNTTLGRIQSLVKNHDGVKDARVYQLDGYDKDSISGTDWTTGNLNEFTGAKIGPTGQWFGFSFKPSDDIATMRGFTTYARGSGDYLPNLDVYLKYHASGLFSTNTGQYLAKTTLYREDLERGKETSWQELDVNLKYNGLDHTKTYRIYMYQTGTAQEGKWEFACTGNAVASPPIYWQSFTGAYDDSEDYILDKNIVFKTKYGSPAFNVDVVTEDGYRFDPDVKEDIEYMLDYEEGGGYVPICIQSTVQEAQKVYVSLSAIIYPKRYHDIGTVRNSIKENVQNYLESIRPGENIGYSQLNKRILDSNGVDEIRNLKFKVNDGVWSTHENEKSIGLDLREYPTLDTSSRYDGISLVEG